ncbi:MAG: 50S ribosomal protein L25 [Patescibacteria group bacterium]|nr:50S ribosomal protein L25 [Patescibacteria group bacterium]
MEDTYSINANVREKSSKNEQLGNRIPAILYGKKLDNIMLWIDFKAFSRVYDDVRGSSVIDLIVENGSKREVEKVLIYDIQRDPVTDGYTHVDFYRVKMDEEIEASVELEFINESLAVKELGGVLVKNIDKVEVRCLPADLPKYIKVDISALETFDGRICVEDLKISDKVSIDLESKTVVALVAPPRSQEDIEELEKDIEGDISQVEDVEKKEVENQPEQQKIEDQQKEKDSAE